MFISNHDQRRLAVALHTALCFENHTDMCSWMYGDWGLGPKATYAHQKYFEKAGKLRESVPESISTEDLITVVQNIPR